MELERSKELREYLRSTLKLPSAFPEPEENPEFYDKVFTQLKSHHETLQEALKSAYPHAQDLQSLVEERLAEDFSKIPNGTSDSNGIRNTIKWMEANGYLLEFIAAAHSRNCRNAKLNLFVRATLKSTLQPLIPPQQVPQPEIQTMTPEPQPKGSDGRVNNDGSRTNNGMPGLEIMHDQTMRNAVPEPDQDHGQRQPMSLPRKLITTEKQSLEDPIASAYKRTRTSREKIQLVYDMFQNGENISDVPIVASIKEAKNAIDRISDIFETIPTPDYPELDYRFVCQEKFIYNKISFIQAYALQGKIATSPSIFQSADKEFQTIFSGLQKLEDFITIYEQQIQSLNHTDEPLLESGS